MMAGLLVNTMQQVSDNIMFRVPYTTTEVFANLKVAMNICICVQIRGGGSA